MGILLQKNKIDVLRHPTTENAMLFWDMDRLGPPAKPDAPLAGLHKARLLWKDSSKKMVKESKKWLHEHGYSLKNSVYEAFLKKQH